MKPGVSGKAARSIIEIKLPILKKAPFERPNFDKYYRHYSVFVFLE